MGRRKKKSKHTLQGCNVNPKETNNASVNLPSNLPKPRYLILSRDHPIETMNDVPSSLLSNVISNVVGKVNSIKKLRNGTVLIETKTETQSVKLMKLKYFPPKVPVQVTPHRWMNYSRGVIKSWNLDFLSIEEIKSELRSQSVVDVKPIMTKVVGEDGKFTLEKSSCYILTFSLPTLPKIVNFGFLILIPIPYVPKPKLCYRCYQYGHTIKYCKSEQQLCSKCIQPNHDSKNCPAAIICANCSEEFQTGHASCLGYMVHRKVMEIDCILKNVNLDD